MADSTVRPFSINIAEDELDDLGRRLAATRWPEAETADGWNQGLPLDYARELCAYWQLEYRWRDREHYLNTFPQFQTQLQGLDIHFIHVKSAEPNARPLLVTHGWPGSIVEFHKVIGPLVDPVAHGGVAEDAFDVICPSLPGYGFSAKPTATGWGVEKIATVWNELMIRLGYERYFAQGGDWGSAVTTAIGLQNLGQCAGIHVNMPNAGAPKEALLNPTERDMVALAGAKYYADWGAGYSKQQSTRPQTLGYALVDSPMGQATWIMEKFYEWTDCDGHPENVLNRDELLDNIMLYWLSGTGHRRPVCIGKVLVPLSAVTALRRSQYPQAVASFPGKLWRRREVGQRPAMRISFTGMNWIAAVISLPLNSRSFSLKSCASALAK